MENNLSLLTELYDIKRRNIDWEIKLENSNNINNNSVEDKEQMTERHEELQQNRLQIIISDEKRNNFKDNNCAKQEIINCNRESTPENSLIISSSNNPLISSSVNTANDGIKNVEQYVERRKINGITWYYCRWSGCDYGSNKSNHLVRHVRTHTGEKPYVCDWPNCGKKFTDSWKRKDHILSHNRKLMTSNQTVVDSGNNSNNGNNFKLFMEMFDSCNDNSGIETSGNVCETINNDIDMNQEFDEESEHLNRNESANSNLNMFIPEVIVSEVDVSSSDNTLSTDNSMSIESGSQDLLYKSVEEFIEKTVKNDEVWYGCKWDGCNFGSNKSQYLVRHIRSHTNLRPFVCEWPECRKRFTDSYKLREHQLTHYRKLITTVGNNNKTSMNLIFDLNNKKVDKSVDDSTNINRPSLQRLNGINGINNKIVNSMTFNVSEKQSSEPSNPKMSIKNVEELVERRKVDGITRYFCKWPSCTYASNKSNHLVRHIRTHKNERNFVCDFVGCGKKFTDSWKLRDHKVYHMNKPTRQVTNSTVTNVSLGINAVEEQSNVDQNFKCELVENPVSKPGIVSTPLLTSCCDEKLTSKSTTTADVVMSIKNVEQYVERRKVNGITFYYCKWKDCNYGSNKSNHLVRHVRGVHTGERPYECDYPNCDKKFTDSWKLKDHKSIHAKKSLEKSKFSLVNCIEINVNANQKLNHDECDEQVLTNDAKEESLDIEDDEQIDLFVPQVIIDESEEMVTFNEPEGNLLTEDPNQGILSIKNVEQYVEKGLKNGLNWYKCKWNGCDFGHIKSSYIVQHVYKHTGEKPYKCNWSNCSEKFNKKQNLTLHMMTHTGEKPLRCQYPNCYYTAVSPEALMIHLSKHSGDTPFKCDWNQCEAQFGVGVELLRHSKTHSGARLHKCPFPNCSYASKYRNKLTIHIRRHNNDRPFKCTFDNCGKCFIVRDKLRRHELTVHKLQFK